MKTVTAVEAKNNFGRLLDTAHREPVVVTKNNREVAALFSMEDVRMLADVLLVDPLRADVLAGRLSALDALMAQMQINRRLDTSRRAIANGNGIVADDAYFQSLRDRALARIA